MTCLPPTANCHSKSFLDKQMTTCFCFLHISHIIGSMYVIFTYIVTCTIKIKQTSVKIYLLLSHESVMGLFQAGKSCRNRRFQNDLTEAWMGKKWSKNRPFRGVLEIHGYVKLPGCNWVNKLVVFGSINRNYCSQFSSFI